MQVARDGQVAAGQGGGDSGAPALSANPSCALSRTCEFLTRAFTPYGVSFCPLRYDPAPAPQLQVLSTLLSHRTLKRFRERPENDVW